MQSRLRSLISRFSQIGSHPSDEEDLRLQKSLLVLVTIPFSMAGLGWGVTYILLGAWQAGLNALIYGISLLVLLVIFAVKRNYPFFRFMQLGAVLIVPFFVMHSLGGFVTGSAVIVWSLLAPMGALLLDKPRRSFYWFAAFLVAVVVSGLLETDGSQLNIALPHALVMVFFVMNLGVVGSLVFLMVYYFVQERNTYQDRSEELLLNILPSTIVQILKKEQRTIANDHENVSVMFADVVDFTRLSETLTPTQLVEMLNSVFMYFDELVQHYGLEKIKTIGDCYMAAAGVPAAHPDHAVRLVSMALDVQDYVQANTFSGHTLAFRIGVNSGPVVAGVIGSKKFTYDLWGDAVNTASRMESHGKAGTIQISSSTHALIEDHFKCTSLGEILVKGKGAMEVWSVSRLSPTPDLDLQPQHL